jgi:hypothetical protein
MPFAQVLMRRRMSLNVHTVIAHIRKLFPSNRFPAA